jgi:hypothetical protein
MLVGSNAIPGTEKVTSFASGAAANIIGGSADSVVLTGVNYVTSGYGAGYPQEINVTVNGGNTTVNTNATSVTLEIPLSMWVPSGVTGAIDVQAAAQSSSIFTNGQIAVGSVGNSTVTLATESTPAISDAGGPVGLIDVTEDAAGALFSGTTQNPQTGLKLTLPPGFKWASATLEPQWGTPSDLSNVQDLNSLIANSTSNDGRELDITETAASTASQYFKLNATVSVDETTAQTGNITVSLGGQTSANVSSLVIGSYGQYGLTCDASGTAPTITAGVQGSNIGELEIKEGVPGSLIWGRTITLTLPTDVAWSEVPSLDTNLSTNTGSGADALNTWTEEGTNGTELQCTLPAGSNTSAGPTSNQSSPGDFFLKNMEVTPAVDFSGPVVVTVGGSEGLTSTITLATVAAGVTAAAASTPDVQIGTASQTLGDITITEAAAGNLGSTLYYTGLDQTDDSNYMLAVCPTASGTTDLDIVAPVGVTFDTTPIVTVTSGNIQLGTPTTGTGMTVEGTATAGNQGVLQIPIDSSSTTASTITISAPVVTIDRTVPEGPITFKCEGTAIDETSLPNGNEQYIVSGGDTYSPLFPNDTTAAKVNVANVTTGTNPGSTTGTAVFTIGQTSYTLNGASVTMDVAPYIENSRTYVPLRYVANAVGVADSNIMYDPTSQKVTIVKGSMVAQFTIGSTTMLINGAAVTMDTAPEITSGRTCLPVAWVAQALGATVAWDATAQTATISF